VISARADVVGSLLRPPWLLEAREAWAGGCLAAAAFKGLEDRAVDEAIALQEGAGLAVVTDGEQRRLSFQSQMTEAVEGFGPHDLDAFVWGEWRGDARVGDRSLPRPGGLGVAGKLRRRRHLCAEELTYLRARTRRAPKITLPAPSLWLNFWPGHPVPAYATLDAFLSDVVDLLREEVAELVRLGAAYLQIDAPHYTSLLDPRARAFYESQGWSAERFLSQGLEMDNAVIGDFPDVTFGLHLCRGNQASRWMVEGGYEPIAAPIFRGTRATRLLLEFDDARSGSFEPIAHAAEHQTVVLGLVTTKSPRLETPAELGARIEEAARFVPRERLALSPQCGFATSVLGNRLSPEDQERKLRTVVATAQAVWGSA
jgi:5-methyltetrahydropteroyltriglutamate--homocysteine methyltransferase